MSTTASAPYKAVEAIAAIARWLPHAPREARPFVAAVTSLLTVECPTLPISIALWQHGAWLLYGVATPAAHTWVADLERPVELPTTRSNRLKAHPANSAVRVLSPDLRIGIAAWGKKLAAPVFDALVAQIEAGFAGVAPEPAVEPVQPASPARTDALAALQRIVHALNATLNLDVVLQAVLREALAVTQAEQGCVALDQATDYETAGKFRYVIMSGFDTEADAALRSYDLGYEMAPADEALRQDRVVRVLSADLPGNQQRALVELNVPIHFQDRVVGLITLRSSYEYAFNGEQIAFMHVVAEQAAVAISNARGLAEQMRQRELLQQRANVLSEVLDVGRLLRADRPLSEVLTDIAYGIVNAVGFRSVLISLRGESNPRFFEPVAFAGILPENVERLKEMPTPTSVVEGLCNERWQLSSSYLLSGSDVALIYGEDVDELTIVVIHEERPVNEWQGDDMFVTPLRNANGDILGVIWIDDPFDRKRPTRRTAEVVEIFANQALSAIENVRLYREAQQRLAEQNALNRIQQAASASLDIRHILREVYAGLQPVLRMDSFYSFVYHHDSATHGLVVSVDNGEWDIGEMPMSMQTGLHGYMMREQKTLLLDNLYENLDRLPPQHRPLNFGDVSRRSAAWIGMPLIAADNEVIGALSVHSYRANVFGAQELEFLQAVGHQVAISLQNARLFAERERRLHEVNVVNRLAQALSAPISLNELAEVLYSQMSQAFDAPSVMLAVYDRQHDLIEFPLFVEDGVRQKLPPRQSGNGLTEYLLRTREPLLLNDDIAAQLTQRGVKVFGEMTRSFAGAPLTVGDEVVGVIAVQHDHRNHAFGPAHLELLKAIALQIASGIEKARLLNERERQIAQMQTLNNIGKVTSSTLDLNELFIDMYIELCRYRKVDTLLLSVVDPQTRTILQMMTLDRDELHRVDQPRPIKPNSYTDVIIRTGQPILFRNAPEEETQHGIDTLMIGSGERAASWAGVPLLNTSGQPFGILSIQSYSSGEYDLRDIDFLTNVAHQIALNIQNAALFKQSQAQVAQLAAETERLELINRVSSWTGAMLDVNELLQRTVVEMARVTSADQSRVLLFDRTRNIGMCHAELRDTGAVGRMAIPLAGNPSIEWMDQQHSSMVVRDADTDPRFAAIHEILRADGIRDILIVPLIVKGEVIGSVGLDARARELTFTERDIATCETIANQVATALENARLWNATQQSVRELTMLYDLSVSLTTMLDLDEIMATVAGGALEVERADLSAVILFDHHSRSSHFVGLTSAGYDVDPEPFLASAALRHVMQERQPRVVHDYITETNADDMRFDSSTQSCVIVPITVKGQSIGALVLACHQPRVWSERAQSLLTILTTQAASAIENAHLFKSEQDRRRSADTLREVALSLSSTLEVDEIFDIVLTQLRRVIAYDSTSVQLLVNGNELEIIAQRSIDPTLTVDSPDLRFPVNNPAYPNHHVVETQQPYIVNDTYIEYPAFATLPHTRHIRSWLGVPLLYGNQLLGMITLDSGTPHFYTRDLADQALMFATQAAQAITQAKLFDQIRRFNAELEQMVAERTAALTAEKDRLEAVHAITTTLTASLDINEIVVKTLELAASAIGVQRGSVLIRDPMQDILVYRAVLTETRGLISTAEPFELPPGNLVQWTLESQQGVFIDDVRRDPRWVEIAGQTNEIRSFVAVPLLAADVPLGVLMLNSRQPGYFNEEHLRLLSTIASEVAIAVHNAELYNFINEQATRLAELLQQQREETGKNLAILESVAEGVLVLDELDTVLLYNRAASQVLRIEDAAIVGRAINCIAEYGQDNEERQRALLLYAALADGIRQARQHGDAQHTIVELPGQTIDTTYTPVTTPDGERVGVAAVLRDITREIEADKAKREFIATVSHELRTPLTSVKGYIDLLMLGTAGPVSDMQKTFLQVVKSNADRLNALVEDLLEISRLENGKVALNVRPLFLPDLVNDICASLRTETERKRMSLSVEIDPLLPSVEADPKRVGQVLTNLLSNAHKYTRDGGQISVHCMRRDDLVQVDVSDTGVGIPPEELPKMFSRFFRTNNALKDEVGGTGLGLSIAKSFIELHGGDMWVTSELEVGSTFSFTLPIEYRRPPQETPSVAPEMLHAG